jgi:hypothetical protein
MRKPKAFITACLVGCLLSFSASSNADVASSSAAVSSLQSAITSCETELASLKSSANAERHRYDAEYNSAQTVVSKAISEVSAAESSYSTAKAEASRKPKDSAAQERARKAGEAVTAARAALSSAEAAKRTVLAQQAEASRKASALDVQVNSKSGELNGLKTKLTAASVALQKAKADEKRNADAMKHGPSPEQKKADGASEKVNRSGARIQKTRTSAAPAPLTGYSDDWYWKLIEFNPPDYIWEWTDRFAGTPKTGSAEPAVPKRDSSSSGWDFGKNPPEETISRGPYDQTKVLKEPNGMPPQPGAAVYSQDGSKPAANRGELAKLFSGLAESGGDQSTLSGANAKGEKVPWSFNGSGIGTAGNGEKTYNAYVGGKLVKTSQRDPNVVSYDPSGMPIGADGLVVEYATLGDRDYSVNVVQKEIAEVRAERDSELRMMFPELYMSPKEIEQKRQADEADRAKNLKWAQDLRASGKPLTATEKYQLYKIEGGKLSWQEEMKLGTDSMAELSADIRKRYPETEDERKKTETQAAYRARLKEFGLDDDSTTDQPADAAAPAKGQPEKDGK